MFTLEDGREHLYQWDLNRRIIVNDPTICEVHFCNRTSDCSLVVKVYTDDTYDGKTYADIPNILLQDARPIRAYAYCDDLYTLTEQQFTVKSRTKPDDYVYTETETLQYSTLGNRIDELQEQVAAVDVSNFYTRAETDAAIEKAREVYYLDFSNVSSGRDATEEETEVFNRLKNGEKIVVYVNDDTLSQQIYAIADIRYKSNSSIYFKLHYTYLASTNITKITEYHAYVLAQSGTWRISNESNHSYTFATEQYVDDAIASIEGGSDADLSNYYTKEETDTAISTAIADIDIPDVTGFAKLEDIPDVSKYQTADQVNALINDALGSIGVAEEGSY